MKYTKPQKLINYLVNESERWSSGALLSDYLDVSTRQIRKYITKINEDVGDNLILSSNLGYKINIDLYRTLDISDKDSPTNRVNYIIQKLISEKHGYDIFDLTEELYVSIPTIENDLKTVRRLFNQFQLELQRNKNILSIKGSETKKRNLMSYLISSESYDNFILKDEVRFLTFHYHFWGFRTTIREIFAKNDIFINDYTLNDTALHLIIMIDRIRNGCILEDSDEINKVKNTQQYNVACQVKDYIEKTYAVFVNNAELYNLTLVISNNTTIIDYSFITTENINQYIEQKYIDIAHIVINKVEEAYCLDAFDEDFITKFTIHVKNLFNRVENNYFAKNPLTSKIKTAFPLIYDIAVFIAQEFKQEYNVHLTEDEITFIAFHIGSYFENNVQRKTKVNCAFIYADYYSLHKNVLNKIMNKFEHQINIKYAISIDSYNPETIKCDLIISTIDMPYQSEAIIIQPFSTDKDINRLHEVIDKIYLKKRNRALKNYLLNFFDSRLFYKNPQFSSKAEAIKKMTKDAINIDFANENFTEDVLARENMSGTAFNNVAVPHSLSNNANTGFISIAISQELLPWNGNQVNIIVLIGINKDSRKIFAELFDALIEILSEPSSVKELVKATDFNHLINSLKTLMDELE